MVTGTAPDGLAVRPDNADRNEELKNHGLSFGTGQETVTYGKNETGTAPDGLVVRPDNAV